MLQVPGRHVEAGPAVLVLLHHRRLPRLARPSQRPYHRAHYRTQTQYPRHPWKDKILLPTSFLAFLLKPARTPRQHRLHRVNTKRPLALALQNPVAEARTPPSNPASHQYAVRQSNARSVIHALCKTIYIAGEFHDKYIGIRRLVF